MRLCSHASPAEELARKDDLKLLFSAITSWCSQYNVMWRKSAAEVLMTLSRHGLSQPVVNYIHSESAVRSGSLFTFLFHFPKRKDFSLLESEYNYVVLCFQYPSLDLIHHVLRMENEEK